MPKLAAMTTGRLNCFEKHRKATKKKAMLGRLPHRAPRV
jgi:hypothetical protein